MSEGTPPDKSDLIQEVTDRLVAMLEEHYGGREIYETLKPLLPSLVNLGLSVSLDAAEEALIGLGSEDPYPYWKLLIAEASPGSRALLMEEARQAAIVAIVREREKESERWTALVAALRAALLLLPLFL